MKIFRLLCLCSLVLTLFLLFNFDSNSVNALEGSKSKVVEKVKCKEQVDEALRQYWDKDGNAVSSPDDEEDDEEDDETAESNDNQEDEDEDEEDDTQNKNSESEDDNTNEEESEEEEQTSGQNGTEEEEESDEESAGGQDVEESDEQPQNSETTEEQDDNASDKVKRDTEEEEEEEEETSQDSPNNSHGVDASKDAESEQNNAAVDEEEAGEEEEEIDEEELLKQQHQQKRSRAHIDDVLQVYEIGSKDDNTEQNLILSIFRDLKRIFEGTVKPLESIYKYRQITTRLITDAEIFSKPMLLFLGGKSTGKSSLINYLLGVDDTPWQIKTGAASQTKFTILSYGENYTHLSPTELSADYTFSSLQRFGEQFLTEYIDAHRLPINILQKLTIVDSPGLIDMSPTKTAKQLIDNDVYQWFIDRSDVIYIVIDVSQLYLSSSLRVLLDQLKGREIRFVISKSDIASHSQIISMMGQLLWVLSPIMSAERPPMVYALTTLPQESFDEFLDDQETSWLKDLSIQLSGISRIESHIAEVRRHAVRVRNHAKLIDCYLSTYYKNKGLFTFGASSRQLAADISENPHQYRIYSGAFMGQLQNVSRYDLPDPGVYREFFRSNPLIDFKPLTSTCSYFRGCPIDKLDIAIAYDLPELVGKYKKLTKTKLDQN